MGNKLHSANWENLPVAPFNPNPDWPDGYFEVLAEAGVPARRRGFYAQWVRQFFNRNPGRPRHTLGPQEISNFLEALRQDAGAQDWQREQARDALILYYEQFRGIPLRSLPKPVGVQPECPPPVLPRRVEVKPSYAAPAARSDGAGQEVDWGALSV